MQTQSYHQPVMLKEAIQGLAIKPNGTYVDLTFGGGSYSKAILNQLTTGHLLSIDQDRQTATQAKNIQNPNFTFIQGNFRHLKALLYTYQTQKINGIVADLGLSSHQLNTPERGFSSRLDGPLDMRMNQKTSLTASKIINTYPLQKLIYILKYYGEIKNPTPLAKKIIQARTINTTTKLKELITPFAPKKKTYKYHAKVFQAFRITVNKELTALQKMLKQTVDLLNPNGRLVILSYHSLEDRIVKNFIKTGNFQGKIIQDIYGNKLRPLTPIHNKVIKPTQQEITKNPRSRSARLRIARLT